MATTYAISPGTTSDNENIETISFTVSRSGRLPAESIFAVTGRIEGFSNAGNYTGLTGTSLSFALNQISATFTVTILNNSVVEPS